MTKLFREGEKKKRGGGGGGGGGMPRRWQCWRRVAGRTTADLAITTKKLVIFRRREFSTPPPSLWTEAETIILFRSPRMPPSGHGITGRTESGGRAAFITLMSGRYLSSQRPKVAPSAVKTRPTAARRQQQRENSISRFIIISGEEPKNFNEQFDKKWARQSERTRRQRPSPPRRLRLWEVFI